MEAKINSAICYVLQSRSYYEQSGQAITDDDDGMFKNDAANIFGDTYEEYLEILKALMPV